MKKFLVLLLIVVSGLSVTDINAQLKVEGQLDLGDNNLSEGLYLQFSGFGHYEEPYWGAMSGYQLGLIQPQNVFFNSWYVSPYGKIPIGNFSLDLGVSYLWTAFSPDLREINWIMFTKTSLKHWELALGINKRIYRLSHKTIKNENISKSERPIIEEWNMMYSVGYALKPCENRWNLMLTVTDYDRFLIQQETNPMVSLRFDYKLSEPLSLYSELWYKSAGLLNIKVNYFGTSLRIGALWEL